MWKKMPTDSFAQGTIELKIKLIKPDITVTVPQLCPLQ